MRSLPRSNRQRGFCAPEGVRVTLLRLTLEFVRATRSVSGVQRIALIGSLTTEKANPKDADVLVTIGEPCDLDGLARLARRLKGMAQSSNAGADVFLTTSVGEYLGRVCHYRECHSRVLCRARHCGRVPHLNDDLDVLSLSPALIATPPVVLHPIVMPASCPIADLDSVLLAPLRGGVEQSGSTARTGVQAI